MAEENSRDLLLIDPNTAIPVQNIRNDIRVIASGNGQTDQIQLEHIPTSTEIEVGDMLVTSGLGGFILKATQWRLCHRWIKTRAVSLRRSKPILLWNLIDCATYC